MRRFAVKQKYRAMGITDPGKLHVLIKYYYIDKPTNCVSGILPADDTSMRIISLIKYVSQQAWVINLKCNKFH